MDDNVPQQPEQLDTEALTATQGLIARLSNQLDELKIKQKEAREMLKGIFEGDEALSKAENQAEEANQAVKSRKSDLNQTQEVKDMKVKISDITEDVKMVEESLNTHLVNYFQMTRSTTIDLPDGTEREFKVKAKLKPKRK